MKRKGAIKRILGIGILSVGGLSSYELISWYKKPDLTYLGSKKALIAALAECIIPKTNTPGAKEAHVEEYILHVVGHGINRYEANAFIAGLEHLEKITHTKYQRAFYQCSGEQQAELLLKMRPGSFYTKWPLLKKAQHKLLGRSFFDLLKELTVTGYCTSEIGATQGLAYIHVPGHYYPCIPLENGQRCWATK